MPAYKKPAASGMKRPASGSITDMVRKMQKGVDGCESEKEDGAATREDTEPEEQQEQTEQSRDKGKGQKYARIKDTLPAHVVDLIEEQSKKAMAPRQFKTAAINRLFKRNANGALELNVTDALFEEHKELFTQKYNKEDEKAVPPGIMLNLYFNGNQAWADVNLKRQMRKASIQFRVALPPY